MFIIKFKPAGQQQAKKIKIIIKNLEDRDLLFFVFGVVGAS